MSIKRIEPNKRMSQCVIHNDIIYFAGMVGNAGETVAEQTKTIISDIDHYLEELGSHHSKLLTVQVWLNDLQHFDEMNKVYDEWINGENPPTRACGEVKLANPEWHVEFIVTAAL